MLGEGGAERSYENRSGNINGMCGSNEEEEMNLGILASVAGASKISSDEMQRLPHRPAESTALFLDGYEGYFDQHKQREKISTTPFTRAPELDSQEFIDYIQLTPAGLRQVQEKAHQKIRQCYKQWCLELTEGFHLCLYGVGSKRQLILDFLDFWEPAYPVVVANGYNSATTFKEILNSCVSAVVDPSVSGDWLKQPSERLIIFLDYLKEHKRHLVLVIQSLDGQALRDDKSQAFITRLVASPYVSLICSVDHLNAPMLWNAQQVQELNFVWHNTTTFQPFTAETAYMDILGLGKSRASVGINGVQWVLSSLTQNAQTLYKYLIEAQYEKMAEQVADPNTMGSVSYGIGYNDLYTKCVEEFIVSHEVNFSQMLTEFIEHKMVEKTKSKTGAEIVFAPCSLDDLEQILNSFA